jgi:hypothetical protein
MDFRFRRWAAYWAKRVVLWGLRDRPRRMRQRGRLADNPVGLSEVLYRRISRQHLSSQDGRLTDAALPFPDQSVNRSKFSTASDALIPDPSCRDRGRWLSMGVAEIPASAVSHSVDARSGQCNILVEHVPLEWNYAHSEIHLYVDGRHVAKGAYSDKLIPKAERKAWRMRVFEGLAHARV